MKSICLSILLLIAVNELKAAEHPRLLFNKEEIKSIKERSKSPILKSVANRIMERAQSQLTAPPLIPSLTKRGEPDPPGEIKGLEAARRLQGRVLTYCMAFMLSGERKYRDAAVAELDYAISKWRIWVDTAHSPPYDLMTGEICLTFGLAYDWLYQDLSTEERDRLRVGVEKRGLQAYLDSYARPASFFKARHNWNTVCNGGATVLALALEGESKLSEEVLKLSIPAMDHYWNSLGEDGGWNEGTGYWTYGHRYAFISAEVLRRSGRQGGKDRFNLPGARRTAYFPIVFNPGTELSASFGDSTGRANDPIFYLLGREYKNPDFIWFQDRANPPDPKRERGGQDVFTLLWRPIGEDWLPENSKDFRPTIDPVYNFPSIGWAFMAPSQPDPPYFLAFKNGSLAANHTHLDLNHISIGYGNTMLAVELGNRAYTADYFSAARFSYYELSTHGHNTVIVGGKGQVPKTEGKLLGPVKGRNFESFIGIADNAYEEKTTRARRHVVFVDKRYWVLLDEIQTLQPQPIELRFHTYADIDSSSNNRWTFKEKDAALDIVSVPEGKLKAEVERPDGWIKPVKVLSLKTKDSLNEHRIVTVLYAHPNSTKSLGKVSAIESNKELKVSVDNDQILFKKETEGWMIKEVIQQGSGIRAK
jgi:hypothetical protein